MTLKREAIVSALIEALRADDAVHAVWEGGSVAWGRADEHSDIDLSVAVEDDQVERVLGVVDATLAALATIDRRRRVPEPTWHGHSQCFYHLEGTPPTLLIDCSVMKRSAEDLFIAPELHGHPLVHFDRDEVVRPPEFDADTLRTTLHQTLERHIATMTMFGDVLVPKEIARGRALDAIQFYQSFTLRPLLHVLSIAHRPLRHQFSRYAHQELPGDVMARLEPLYFVRDLEDLADKHERAVKFFWEVVESLDIDALDLDGMSCEARETSRIS